MILDALETFADDLAYNSESTVIDLKSTNRGPGNPICCFVLGNGLSGVTATRIGDRTRLG